jgi:exopolysaccharide production protein ExoQ
MPARPEPHVDWLQIAASPRVLQVLTTTTFGVAFLAHAIRALAGWAGLIAMLSGLVVLWGLALVGARDRLEWRAALPFSLLILFGWAALSITWSQYTIATGTSVLYLAVFMVLGFALALSRDLIQLVRSMGDALRFVLLTSLVVEIVAGLLIDQAIPFLGVSGSLATGGPIQGLGGTRNYLGFLAGLAVITFATEWRTHSIPNGLAIGSLIGAGAVVLLTRSPVTIAATIAVLAAGAALLLLRRVGRDRQPVVQLSLLAGLVSVGVVAWVARGPLISLLNATSELEFRTGLWRYLGGLIDIHQLQGWGWLGLWRRDVFPYSSAIAPNGRAYGSALNVFVDAWLQIGLIGAAILVVALGLAFVRAWLVASENPIVVYVWPTLVLTLLGVTSLAESYLLAEGGMLLFVVCATAVSRKRSWRGRVRDQWQVRGR